MNFKKNQADLIKKNRNFSLFFNILRKAIDNENELIYIYVYNQGSTKNS